MQSKVSSIIPLPHDAVRSLAPARGRILSSIAGRARVLHELATGVATVDGEMCTPMNPQGLIGIDHSGPPWGQALRHSLWHVGAAAANAATTWSGVRGSLATISAGAPIGLYAVAWNKRHDQGTPRGPYSRGYPWIAAYVSSGAGPVDVLCEIVTLTGRGDPSSTTHTFSISATGTSETRSYLGGGDAWVGLRPGANRCLLRLSVDDAETDSVVVNAAGIEQIEKLHHAI